MESLVDEQIIGWCLYRFFTSFVFLCVVPEVFPRDRVQFLCSGTVDASLCSFPWSFQEHGEDGEQYRHQSRMSGQVRVYRPRMNRVHCDISSCERNAPTFCHNFISLNFRQKISSVDFHVGFGDILPFQKPVYERLCCHIL